MSGSGSSGSSGAPPNAAQTIRNHLRSQPYRAACWPTLDDVLNDKAFPPYNLRAFIKYLSQNHCLETLEFILEARRYRQSYESLVEPAGESIVTACSARVDLSMLYQLLLTTYILPGAPCEVNLTVTVRDALLQFRNATTPPLPQTLDVAVKSIHDLMEDSIFVSFLNSSAILCGDTTLKATNQNESRPYTSRSISQNQPTKTIRTKRPSLRSLGRTWSWPPWNQLAE